MTIAFDSRRNSWYVVVDLPRGEDGKRRQKKKRGFADEATARAWEAQVLAQIAATTPAKNGTVQAELDAWLDRLVVSGKPSTVQGHRTKLRTYVYPRIGRMMLYEVDAKVLETLYATLLKEGKVGRKDKDGAYGPPSGLAPSSVRSTHKALVSGLRACGLVLRERDIRKPAAKVGRRGVWTDEQARIFLNGTVGNKFHIAWVLAIICGMRRGEISGMRWDDVDLDRGVIHIRNNRVAVDREPGGVSEGTPKPDKSHDIAIGPVVVTLMRAWRLACDHDSAYVLVGRTGKPRYPGYFTQQFSRQARALGLPRIALHDARHTSATIALAEGVDVKTLQSRLGHADATTTLNIYGHRVGTAERAAAVTMEDALLDPGTAEAA